MPTLAEKYALTKPVPLAKKYALTKPTSLAEKYALPKADLTPLFEADDPFTEAFAQAGTQFVSSAGFGLPEFIAQKAGYKIPAPETPAGKIGAGVGQLGGFIIGGPMRVGTKVATKLIKPVGRYVIPKILGQGAIRLAVASATMTPEEGLFAPASRIKQFASGAVTGTAFGGLSFIPSTPLRMATMSGMIGIPSTMREDPLEEQIFSYGLGAWFGRKGMSAKSIIAQQKQLEKFIRSGAEGDLYKKFLSENRLLLGEKSKYIKGKGRLYPTAEKLLDDLSKRGKPFDYEFDAKGNFKPYLKVYHKPQLEKMLWAEMKRLKADPYTRLRNDDVTFILNRIPTKKSLVNFTDKQLQSFLNILQNPPKAPEVTSLQPNNAQPLNFWDKTLRPFYAVMKKMGFGDFSQKGLTNTMFTKDAQMAVDNQTDRVIFDNWKRAVGLRPELSRDMARWLDGKVTDTYLTKNFGGKVLPVAKQVRQWYDLKIEGINRHRARYGLDPIKPLKNYYTHLFDTMQAELSQPNKYHLPYDLVDALQFITPKEKFFAHALKRKGKQGYIYDIWKALDIYSMRANWSMNDNFLRDAHRYIRFVTAMQKDPELPETVKYMLYNTKDNLKKFVQEYTGRPGSFDKSLRNTMNSFNRILVNAGAPEGAIKTVSELSNFMTSFIYGTQMAFRPKLAIRNLGQHSLIIGQTGFKPLAKALSVKRTPEILNILSKSNVVKSRAMAFAPETGRLRGFVKSGMWMYRKADMKNVTDAFLAGYFQAKGQGLSEARAIARGDQVAGLTQFIYLKGNRSGLGRGLGLSRTLGRPMSVFTTWSANYIEFLIASSAPEHRANLIKYLATGTGIVMLSALAGVKGAEYVGFTSPRALYNVIRKGQLPAMGIAARIHPLKPSTWMPQIVRDIQKGLEEDGWAALFYTFEDTEE